MKTLWESLLSSDQDIENKIRDEALFYDIVKSLVDELKFTIDLSKGDPTKTKNEYGALYLIFSNLAQKWTDGSFVYPIPETRELIKRGLTKIKIKFNRNPEIDIQFKLTKQKYGDFYEIAVYRDGYLGSIFFNLSKDDIFETKKGFYERITLGINSRTIPNLDLFRFVIKQVKRS